MVLSMIRRECFAFVKTTYCPSKENINWEHRCTWIKHEHSIEHGIVYTLHVDIIHYPWDNKI